MSYLMIAGPASVFIGLFVIYCLVRADFENIPVDRRLVIPAVLLVLGGVLLSIEQLFTACINLFSMVM